MTTACGRTHHKERMRIEIKIEEMPDAMAEFVLVVVKECTSAPCTAAIMAIADKVLSKVPGSKLNEPLPEITTVTSYWIPIGSRTKDAGLRAAQKVRRAICNAGYWQQCGTVTRITTAP